ncbi:hypothetical protein Droror1_Dr00001299 [Drosera rotundifolia]
MLGGRLRGVGVLRGSQFVLRLTDIGSTTLGSPGVSVTRREVSIGMIGVLRPFDFEELGSYVEALQERNLEFEPESWRTLDLVQKHIVGIAARSVELVRRLDKLLNSPSYYSYWFMPPMSSSLVLAYPAAGRLRFPWFGSLEL